MIPKSYLWPGAFILLGILVMLNLGNLYAARFTQLNQQATSAIRALLFVLFFLNFFYAVVYAYAFNRGYAPAVSGLLFHWILTAATVVFILYTLKQQPDMRQEIVLNMDETARAALRQQIARFGVLANIGAGLSVAGVGVFLFVVWRMRRGNN